MNSDGCNVCIVFELQCTVNEVPTYSTYKITLWITNPSVVTFTNISVFTNKTKAYSNNHSYSIISMFKLYCYVHKRYNISKKSQQGPRTQQESSIYFFGSGMHTYSLKPRNITHQKEKYLEMFGNM